MSDPRKVFFVAGLVFKKGKDFNSSELRVITLVLFSVDAGHARELALGAILSEFPMKDGWIEHEVFIRLLSDDVLAEWGYRRV